MRNHRFIELITKALTGELTSEEQKELQFLLQDRRLAEQYRLYEQYWNRRSSVDVDNRALFESVQEKILFHEKNPQLPVVFERSYRSSGWYKWVISVAAVLLFVFSFFFLTIERNGYFGFHSWDIKAVARGNREAFVLPDGSRVKLNSDSKLRYPKSFSGTKREVYLSGEAFFDVKKDRAHPFIIHAGKMTIRVLGTAFNVKAYADEPSAETTLLRGTIEVTLESQEARKIVLKPTEKLIVDYPAEKPTGDRRLWSGKDIARVVTQLTYLHKQDSTIIETGWLDNKLIFRDETFENLTKSMGRWYNKNIYIKRSDLKNLKFSANFDSESLEDALKALQMTEPFNFKIQGNDVFIY